MACLWLACGVSADEPAGKPGDEALLPKQKRPIHEILGEQFEKIDPLKDGWDTEAFSESASQQLERFGKTVGKPEKRTADVLAGWIGTGFACGDLRPRSLREVYRDGPVSVSRPSAAGPADPSVAKPVEAGTSHQGADGFAAEWKNALAPFESEPVRIKFKLFRVERDGDTVKTSAYFQAYGVTEAAGIQQNSLWNCRWVVPADADAPRLVGIEVEAFEEVVVSGARARRGLFSDRTRDVFAGASVYRDQLSRGIDYWRSRIESTNGIDVSGFNGLAVGDANGDGLDDVYICQAGGLPNRLLLQNPDGTVRDVSAAARCDFLDRTNAALFVDLDNDGDQDLVLSTDYFVMFLQNDGQPRFRLMLKQPTEAMAYSLSAVDFDQDGDLDVYVCHHAQAALPLTGGPTSPNPWHDANNGAPNHLYRNEGGWKFKDVTREVGLDMNNRRFSWASAWEDFDNDGDLDLYVANDFGRNNLYRNDGGRFVDIAATAGVEDTSAGMSVSWGDANRDGWMDLYVGNMFSSAGNRITYQRQFKAGLDAEHLAEFRRHARGNSLFENARDGTFRDVSVEAAVTMGRWSWSSLFADINNDGFEDLLVSNGYVTQGPGDL